MCLSNASAGVCGLVQQARCAALTANGSACWLQLTWDKVHSANVEVMGESKSDNLKGGEGVASGSLQSHWGIASAVTPGQPFPVCLCRRPDAAAGSARPFLRARFHELV